MGTVIFTILAILIVSIISAYWDRWALKKVEYKRYIDKDRVFPGERIVLTTEITNRKILPLPWIEITTNIPGAFNFRSQKAVSYSNEGSKVYSVVTSLISYQRVKRYNSLTCNKRGYYTLYDVDISVGDFFGLSVAEKKMECPFRLIVYPNIKPLEELIGDYKKPQGNISVKRWIIPDPMDVIGAREYTDRDSFNTIDWKTTARMGKFYVKKFNYTSEPSIMMILNVQTSKVYWQDVKNEYIEQGIEIVASIMNRAIDEKVPVGYTSNGLFKGENPDIYIEPKASINQKNHILEALSKTTNSIRNPIEDLIGKKIRNLSKGSSIIIITTYVSDKLTKEINYLSKIGYSVKVILLDEKSTYGLFDKKVEIIYLSDKRVVAMEE